LQPTHHWLLKVTEYGNATGKKVIYFHGAPGSPEECLVFHEHAKNHNLNVMCFDRFNIDLSLNGKAYYQKLVDAIKVSVDNEQIDIIGFSIGCKAAIETSLSLGHQVSCVLTCH